MLAPHVVATVAMAVVCEPMIYVVYLSFYLNVSMTAFYNIACNEEGKGKKTRNINIEWMHTPAHTHAVAIY